MGVKSPNNCCLQVNTGSVYSQDLLCRLSLNHVAVIQIKHLLCVQVNTGSLNHVTDIQIKHLLCVQVNTGRLNHVLVIQIKHYLYMQVNKVV